MFSRNQTPPAAISTLSLHDALPISTGPGVGIQLRSTPHKGRLVIPCDHSDGGEGTPGGEDKDGAAAAHGSHVIYSDDADRKSTRLNSSHGYISYAVFCLKKKKTNTT